MLRPHFTSALAMVAVLGLGFTACDPGSSRSADDDRALAESAAVYEEVSQRFRKVGETTDLHGPESARYDRDLDVWFVSNVNGSPTGKDNNGYISRLRPDGSPYNLRFIEGGKKGLTLNAPKGLAIKGDTLWVADIDYARAFNKRTGASIANVNVRGRVKFLNGATVGPDGAIYMTDTGVIFGPKGEMSHPGPDQVVRVTRAGATTTLASPKLEAPNGITWDSREKRFVIVSFGGKGIYGWKPNEKDVTLLGSGPGQQDGVVALPDGRLLVTSWADSSLFAMARDGKIMKVASGIPSPADIDFAEKDSRVAVPQLMANKVQFWELP